MSKEPFGFTVEKTKNQDREYDGKFMVYLPHSCDSWCIAGENYGDGVSKEEAVTELERFIEEAQETLEKLKGMK